jgi:UDP-N-acetylmuramate dehydrogenase
MSGRPAGGADQAAVTAAARVLGQRAIPGLALAPLTTYKVGGPAALGLVARSEEDLEAVGVARAESGLPVLVVGRGSNLVVADRGFGGIAVILDDSPPFNAVTFEGTRVRAGGAVPLPALARRSVEAGLTGFEWAVGVPGSVGGGVRMNAGGHGSTMAACLVSARRVDLRDGSVVEVPVADLHLGYRRSAVASHHVITGALLDLGPGDVLRGRATIRQIVQWRREHQPGGQNAGSVFTNPTDDPEGRSAGWLIEAVGFKGQRLGSAVVSSKHANFIQADAGGSADDIAALIATTQAAVFDRFGVHLHPELRLVGFDGLADPEPSTSTTELPTA